MDDLRAKKEIEALTAMPCEEDPDLSWEAPPGADLPYEGEIPPAVLALAEQRRRKSL